MKRLLAFVLASLAVSWTASAAPKLYDHPTWDQMERAIAAAQGVPYVPRPSPKTDPTFDQMERLIKAIQMGGGGGGSSNIWPSLEHPGYAMYADTALRCEGSRELLDLHVYEKVKDHWHWELVSGVVPSGWMDAANTYGSAKPSCDGSSWTVAAIAGVAPKQATVGSAADLSVTFTYDKFVAKAVRSSSSSEEPIVVYGATIRLATTDITDSLDERKVEILDFTAATNRLWQYKRDSVNLQVWEPWNEHWTWSSTDCPAGWLAKANAYLAPKPESTSASTWKCDAIDGCSFDSATGNAKATNLVFTVHIPGTNLTFTAVANRHDATNTVPVLVHGDERLVTTTPFNERWTLATNAFVTATNELHTYKRDKLDRAVYERTDDHWVWSSPSNDWDEAVNAYRAPKPVYDAGSKKWLPYSWAGKTLTNTLAVATGAETNLSYYVGTFTAAVTRVAATNDLPVFVHENITTADSKDIWELWEYNRTNVVKSSNGTARMLPPYLHYLEYADSYPVEARWYYDQAYGPAGCSSVRDGQFHSRNYDWNYDASVVVVVSMLAGPDRFASIGVGGAGTNLTEEVVSSGEWSKWYKAIPGHMLDGINSEGVCVNINVVSSHSHTNGWHGNPAADGIHCLAAVRWVLDHATNAQHGAEILADRVYVPQGALDKGFSFHYMISDADSTWIVEDGWTTNFPGRVAMTNFRLLDANDPCGTGRERWAMLTNGADITAAWYTGAYTDSANKRLSEFIVSGTETEAELTASWQLAHDYWVAKPREEHRGETLGGETWWQTVHTAVYDLISKSVRVCVQENPDWYVFQIPAAGGSSGGGITRLELQVATNAVYQADRQKVDLTVYDRKKDHWTWAFVGGTNVAGWVERANDYPENRPWFEEIPGGGKWHCGPVGGCTPTNAPSGLATNLVVTFLFEEGFTGKVSRASATSDDPVVAHGGHRLATTDITDRKTETNDFITATNLLEQAKRDKDDYRVWRKMKDCWTWTSSPTAAATNDAPADYLAYMNSPSAKPIYFIGSVFNSWYGGNLFWPDGKRKYFKNALGPAGDGSETNLQFEISAYDRTGTNELYRFGARAVRQDPTNETLVSWSDKPVNEFIRLATTDLLDFELNGKVGTNDFVVATNLIETYKRDKVGLRVYEPNNVHWVWTSDDAPDGWLEQANAYKASKPEHNGTGWTMGEIGGYFPTALPTDPATNCVLSFTYTNWTAKATRASATDTTPVPVNGDVLIATTDITDELERTKVPWTLDVQTNLTALTVGTRTSDGPVGPHSVVLGYGEATNDAAVAFGHLTKAYGLYSLVYGLGSKAEKEGTVAGGDSAWATNAFAWVWSGLAGKGVTPFEPYVDHGAGTFNVNPTNGAAGFYVGETNLAAFLEKKVDRTVDADTNLTALTIGDRNTNFTVGAHSVVLGTNGAASAAYARAGGYNAVASNAYAVAWQGVVTNRPYGSHGDGTVSLNPVGGTEGVWIGETNLATLLDEKFDKKNVVQFEGEGRDTVLSQQAATHLVKDLVNEATRDKLGVYDERVVTANVNEEGALVLTKVVATNEIGSAVWTGRPWFEALADETVTNDIAHGWIIDAEGNEAVCAKSVGHYLANGQLEGSLVYLCNCYSGYEETLANALLAKGAAAVVGHSHRTQSFYGDAVMHAIASRLAETNSAGVRYTLAEAVDFATAKWGHDDKVLHPIQDGARPRIFGDADYRVPTNLAEVVTAQPYYWQSKEQHGDDQIPLPEGAASNADIPGLAAGFLVAANPGCVYTNALKRVEQSDPDRLSKEFLASLPAHGVIFVTGHGSWIPPAFTEELVYAPDGGADVSGKRDKDDLRVYEPRNAHWTWVSTDAEFVSRANVYRGPKPQYYPATSNWMPLAIAGYTLTNDLVEATGLETNLVYHQGAFTVEVFRVSATNDFPVLVHGPEFVATSYDIKDMATKPFVTNTIETYQYRLDTTKDWFNLRAFRVYSDAPAFNFIAYRADDVLGKHFHGTRTSAFSAVEADILYGFIEDAPKFVLSATGTVFGVTYRVEPVTESWGPEETHVYSNALVTVSADGTVTNTYDVTLTFIRDEIVRMSELDNQPAYTSFQDVTNLVRTVPIPQRQLDPEQSNFGIWEFEIGDSLFGNGTVKCAWEKDCWHGSLADPANLDFTITGVNTNGTYEFEVYEATNDLRITWTGLGTLETNLTYRSLGLFRVKPVLESRTIGEDEVRALIAAHVPDVKPEMDLTPSNAVLVSTIESVSAGYTFVYHGYGEFTLVMADGTIAVATPYKVYRHVVSFSWNAPNPASFFTLDGTHNLVRSPEGYAVKDFTTNPDGYQLYSSLSNGDRPLTGVLTCPVSITVEE